MRISDWSSDVCSSDLRLALIDRRQSAREQDLAPDVELLRRFVTGIDASGRLQFLELGLVQRKARRLAFLAVDVEAEPGQVGADAIDIFLFRPLAVGVVDPQQEPPAMLPPPQPLVA